MNFTGRTVLVYLEEDNIQRAYFRVRPLLTDLGPVGQDIASQYPDEGYLRIVPDKNEQHTFKDRMRTLGSICLLDLSTLQSDSQKIRSNKNYSPSKGEKNQFIVYSDAVRALDGRFFFHVVSEDRADSAVTPMYYTRSGANIQGPFTRGGEVGPEGLKKILPDDPRLYTAVLPDGTAMLIYLDAPARAAEETGTEAKEAEESPAEQAPESVPAADPAAEETGSEAPAVSEAPEAPETPETPAAAPEETPAAAPASAWQRQLNAILSGKEPAAAPAKAEPARTEKQEARTADRKSEKASDRAAEKAPEAPREKGRSQRPREQETALGRIQALNGTLNVTAQRLKDDGRSYPARPAEAAAPAGATKLYRPGTDRRVNMRARNSLAEAVEQQRSLSRYETRGEAPGAQISDPGSLGSVPNPVESFRAALRRTWMLPDTHRQVAECILATSGMRQVLGRTLTDGKVNLTIRAMQSQLQDLEAERLMTLMQLDDAKKNLQAAQEAAAARTEKSKQAQIDTLDRILSEKKALVESMTAGQEALRAECARAAETLSALPEGEVLCAPAAVEAPGREALVSRFLGALKAAGFEADEDSALALLILLAQSGGTGRMGIASEGVADALLAAERISEALGAVSVRTHLEEDAHGYPRIIPGGDGMILLSDTCPCPCEVRGAVHIACLPSDDVYLSRLTDRMIDQYRADPFPVWWVRQDPGSIPEGGAVLPAVSAASLAAAVLEDRGSLDEHTLLLLKNLRLVLRSAGAPLPGRTAAAMRTFILSAAPHMKGGIAAALDWAVLCYVVPHVRFSGVDGSILTDPAAALPRALQELSR